MGLWRGDYHEFNLGPVQVGKWTAAERSWGTVRKDQSTRQRESFTLTGRLAGSRFPRHRVSNEPGRTSLSPP